MWTIHNRDYSTIAVVDDEDESRESLRWLLSDADLDIHLMEGPLTEVETTSREIRNAADALICDHRLNSKNYARFDGAELVSATIRKGFPAILCTRYRGIDIESIRPRLPDIPVILRWDQMNEPEELYQALDDCISELNGKFSPERKPWRAQLVVEQVDHEYGTFDISIPAWELDESIRIRKRDLPKELITMIKSGFRTHAQINIGAQSADQLFVTDWETPWKPR